MAGDEAPRSPREARAQGASKGYFLLLSLTTLGVVYGDIGTSPLYAMREAFFGPYGVPVTPANVLGVLSLIFWALVLVISVKYLAFILRADNEGEGGILALMSLVHPGEGPAWTRSRRALRGRRLALVLLGLFGASLLYGDGMITPAISVLSAVEGLKIVTPVFEPFIIPITVAILIGLFVVQRRGTAGVGVVFGPITLLWFVTLAVLGIAQIVRNPGVLAALNPAYGVAFFAENGLPGFFVLGAVFLVVTGGEALYADIGHFGTRPIRITWFVLVLPALLLNYLGQGALLLADPAAAANPFYLLAPSWALVPLVVLATLATIIASQAIISGVFSLTMQAVQMGYLPRLRIDHTSPFEIGQIYVSRVNWALMLASIALVVGFRSSSALAAAYGVAVSTDMVIATLLFGVVARELWKWTLPVVIGLVGGFLVVDASFFLANIVKLLEGGWVPLVVALAIFTLMTTWRRGRGILADRLRESAPPLDDFLRKLARDPPMRVSGSAVYMTSNPSAAPPALLRNLEHNKVLHEHVALMSFMTGDVPHVPPAERVRVEHVQDGIHRVTARYGFMDEPDVPAIIRELSARGLEFDLRHTTFFVGRERLIASDRPHGMARWREKLFAFMSRNAEPATAYFRIPADRVVEMGAQVEL